MPAPEPRQQPSASHRPSGDGAPRRELDAVPAFLRTRAADRPSTARGSDSHAATGRPAIPRPVTPPPPAPTTAAPRLDPATLPMPSLSRRRVVTAAGVLAAALLALSFARQVGEATAATNRAADLRAGNEALRTEVARLERDLSQVQDPRFIKLQARAYGLGGPKEIPFALAAGASPLPGDAPGSASVRLGAEPRANSPIEAWIEVLFGPRG